MTLPNFLIIGAAKSGTTALYTYLKQHPDIFMSPRKELRYFSNITPPPPGVPTHPAVESLEEYESYFEGVSGESAIGESSPMYLYTPGTAERIYAVLPNVKLLAILRNPVDRAYSSYTHALRDWKETAPSFREALACEPERIEAGWGMLWHYTEAGFYHQQLKRYYQVFDPEQIKVVLYDDLVVDARALLREIFLFLDVDPTFEPDTSARPNVSGFPKNKTLHRLMKRVFIEDNPLKRVSRKVFPTKLRKRVRDSLRNPNLEKRRMPPDLRAYLQGLYRDEIRALEGLTGRDLSHWLGKSGD